jgi:hypothetical protein
MGMGTNGGEREVRPHSLVDAIVAVDRARTSIASPLLSVACAFTGFRIEKTEPVATPSAEEPT